MANLRNGFSIRHEHHETLGETTRLYLGNETGGSLRRRRDLTDRELRARSAGTEAAGPRTSANPDLSGIISSASARSQIDADFIASVIRAESANNPRAVSPKGAQGLMQLMPQTAKHPGRERQL